MKVIFKDREFVTTSIEGLDSQFRVGLGNIPKGRAFYTVQHFIDRLAEKLVGRPLREVEGNSPSECAYFHSATCITKTTCLIKIQVFLQRSEATRLHRAHELQKLEAYLVCQLESDIQCVFVTLVDHLFVDEAEKHLDSKELHEWDCVYKGSLIQGEKGRVLNIVARWERNESVGELVRKKTLFSQHAKTFRNVTYRFCFTQTRREFKLL